MVDCVARLHIAGEPNLCCCLVFFLSPWALALPRAQQFLLVLCSSRRPIHIFLSPHLLCLLCSVYFVFVFFSSFSVLLILLSFFVLRLAWSCLFVVPSFVSCAFDISVAVSIQHDDYYQTRKHL